MLTIHDQGNSCQFPAVQYKSGQLLRPFFLSLFTNFNLKIITLNLRIVRTNRDNLKHYPTITIVNAVAITTYSMIKRRPKFEVL